MKYLMVHSHRKEEGMVEVEILVLVCELHKETCALSAVGQQLWEWELSGWVCKTSGEKCKYLSVSLYEKYSISSRGNRLKDLCRDPDQKNILYHWWSTKQSTSAGLCVHLCPVSGAVLPLSLGFRTDPALFPWKQSLQATPTTYQRLHHLHGFDLSKGTARSSHVNVLSVWE